MQFVAQWTLLLLLVTVTCANTLSDPISAKKANSSRRDPYTVWCVGNCDHDVSPESTPGVVLMGGGTDTTEAFEWQSLHANGGDFVVMRSSGDDAYNDWIMEVSVAAGKKLNSVTTILFKSEEASYETEVLDIIRNAEAIFFAGGDQSEYLKFWSDTEVQRIIQDKVASTTIGGTSAGLAILGNWVYSAEEGSIDTMDAMSDPYDRDITIVSKFLDFPYLETIITDTHFVTRDRMGRMLTFVARILEDNGESVAPVRGVGVDEHTALLLNTSTGDIEAVGVGTAYVCTADHRAEICLQGKPLTFKNVECTRLSAKQNDKFSFATFDQELGGVTYINNITAGHYGDFPYGPKSEEVKLV